MYIYIHTLIILFGVEEQKLHTYIIFVLALIILFDVKEQKLLL